MTVNRRNSPLFNPAKERWEAFRKAYTGPYDLGPSVYAGQNKKIQFVCPTHGLQDMDAKNMMAGKQCKLCAFAARKGVFRITQKQMLERFATAHGGRYGYGLALYKGQNTPVAILCKDHGVFMQQPEFHWNGSGCPVCFHENVRGNSSRDTLESFSKKLYNTFSGLLSCADSVYVNSQTPIVVKCTKHNTEHTTRPNWLLNGNNPCTKCNHMRSTGEQAVADYVGIFTKVVARDRTFIGPKELDIYLPEKALAIEYCGAFWHSHFDAAAEKKNKHNHVNKHKACAEKGVRLITIFDAEWEARKHAIKRLLRNALGKSKGKLMARKCTLQKVELQEAKAFYERYHPQGGEGAGVHYGLFWKGKLVACMRFTLGVNDRGTGAAKRMWTLSRYATRITVSGAASRLFKAFVTEYAPAVVKSFSDNRYFSGGMYEQLGFTLEEELQPDYQVWSPKRGLLPKTAMQRRNIHGMLLEHGVEDTFDCHTDKRTEAEMTYVMGCGRLYDCGKKRWVWLADGTDSVL